MKQYFLVAAGTWTIAIFSVMGLNIHWIRRQVSALSISLPVDDVLATARLHILGDSAVCLMLWFLGLAGLRYMNRRLGKQIVATQRSQRQRRKIRQRLAFLASYDRLTGLPNQALFDDRLRLALGNARRRGSCPTIAVLAIDHFRAINHVYGLATSNFLTKEAAARLSGCLRATDTTASVGDGRFLLLLTDLRGRGDAARLAKKIQKVFLPPLALGQDITFTVSLGLAMFPDDGQDGNELLRKADTALSRAQEAGTNTFQLYADSMNDGTVAQITLEGRLRKAFDLGQLELHYQPQVDPRRGEIVGAEALLRWQHPVLGKIAPAQFIPVAEESGIIIDMGEWVLRTACREAARWERLTGRSLPVAVNLSPRQFQHPGLVDLVEGILQETGLRPECLELEIVESSVIRDIDQAIETLTDLKIRGIKVAVDDFGIGYSSLNYLKRLPIDRIKIDRSFVCGLDSGEGDDAIVSLVAEIARKMGLELVAEGVETASQRDYLLAHHCFRMQGYLFSPPVQAEIFESLILAPAMSRQG